MNYYTTANNAHYGIDENVINYVRKNWQGWWNATAVFNEDGVIYINKDEDKEEAEFDCDFSKL